MPDILTPFQRLCDWNTLKHAYKQTQLGLRKFRREAVLYDMERERNLALLWNDLRNGTYLPGDYIEFTVYEPKQRLIQAPHLRDKIVEFSAHRILQELYAPVFIKDSYACQDEKGTHDAVDTVQHYMRVCQWQHGGGWIVKLDVKKFFYNIDRELLKTLYRKRIKDEDFLRVLDAIVDSSPCGERGVPLGNATSQNFANITLNELDQYCKRWLGLKWYVRYMDDVIAILPTRQEARETLAKMTEFLTGRLHLAINEKKTKIFPLTQGVNAYGYKIYTTHRLLRDQSKRAMKRRLKAMARNMDAAPPDERKAYKKRIEMSVASWLGHARHSNSYNLARKLFRPYPFIKVEHPKYYFGKRLKYAPTQ
jgi:retron-type reverse transcriptase